MKISILLGAALLPAGAALAQTVNTGPAYDARTLFSPSFIEQLATPTRTAGGQPGAQYWQNAADYKINASLDEKTRPRDGHRRHHLHQQQPRPRCPSCGCSWTRTCTGKTRAGRP